MKKEKVGMGKVVVCAFVLLILVLVFAGVVPVVAATTWTVDDSGGADFTTIQVAVDAASEGDTIIVRDGTYTENVDVNKPHLTIRSENGAASTIVQATNSSDHVFGVTSDYVNISGFTIKGANGGYPYYACGIHLYYANHCNLCNNYVINNNHYGIRLEYSNSNTLAGNTVDSNYFGVELLSSSCNILKKNNANSNTWYGIVIWGSDNNVIIGNIALNNNRGIALGYSSNNTVSFNNASNNSIGIEIQQPSDSNTISNNMMSLNSEYGIRITTYGSSNNNIIYLNNFIDNAKSIYYSPNQTNIWNSAEKITYTYNDSTHTNYLGNYWSSDYTGNDADGDGIGDTSYPIDSDNDNYPLMEPFEIYEIGPAPSYSVSGTVYYSTTPLDGVTVELVQGAVSNPPLQSTTTDSNGHYIFSSAAPGSYWVKAYGPTPEYIGWKALSPIEVVTSDVTQDIDLPKKTTLLSPENNAIVPALHPVLSWEGSSEASRYMIQVNVLVDWQLVEVGKSTSTNYTVEHELTPGVDYAWQVDAYDVQNHHVGTTQTAFRFTVSKPPPEKFWVEVTGTGSTLAIRQTPTTQENNVLKRVPDGWVLNVTNTHQDEENHDGYTWWEVEDITDNIKGWSASEYLKKGDQEELRSKTRKLNTRSERISVILEAVNHYYNNEDTTPSLYSSKDGDNDFSIFKDNDFSIELILAMIAQESGGAGYNNERNDAEKMYNDDGIMQIDYEPNKGNGCGIKCNSNNCKYYTNTTQGVYANLKDGLRVLQDFYTYSNHDDIGAVWRYNGGNNPYGTYCDGLGDSSYLKNVADKLDQTVQKDFGYSNSAVVQELRDAQEKVCCTIYCFYNKTYNVCEEKCNECSFKGIFKGGRANTIPPETCPELRLLVTKLKSPGELRVYDSQGRVTGLVNGEIKNEIPGSEYSDGTVTIFFPSDTYTYEVVGTDEGPYEIEITSVEDGEATTFTATDIPTTVGASHQYTIDWETVSEGEEGVTVQVDSDGDGEFEQTFTADDELSREEYLSATNVPYIKEDAITDLETIDTSDKHAQKDIDKAIKHIQKSLEDELWVDGLHLDTEHGKKVFDEEKKAVKHLTKLCKCKGIADMTLEYNGSSTVDIRAYDKKGTMIAEVLNASKGDAIFINGTTLAKGKLGTETTVKIYDNATGTLIDTQKIHTSCSQPLDEGMTFGDLEVTEVSKIIDLQDVVCPTGDIIKKLVQADEMLAKAAIDNAKATPVIDPKNQDKVDKEIAKAEDELAKAEDKLNEGKPDKAIDHYKKAWKHAQQAIEHAKKLPKK